MCILKEKVKGTVDTKDKNSNYMGCGKEWAVKCRL